MNAATPHEKKHSAVLRSGALALGACAVTSLAGCSTKGVAVATDPVAAVRNAATANKVHTAKVATSVTMSVDGKDQLFIGDGSFDMDKQIGVIVLTIPQVATPLEEVITPTTLYMRRVGQEAKWRWIAGSKLPDGDVISAGYTSPVFDFALLRGVTAGAVHYVGQDTVRGAAVAHYTGILDLDSSAAESSDPIKSDLLAAARSFTQKTIPFDAYLDAQGNVRRVVAHFTFPAEKPQHGEVQIAATTDLYDLGTPVTVSTPPLPTWSAVVPQRPPADTTDGSEDRPYRTSPDRRRMTQPGHGRCLGSSLSWQCQRKANRGAAERGSPEP